MQWLVADLLSKRGPTGVNESTTGETRQDRNLLTAPGQLVPVRKPDTTTGYGLAPFTTDTGSRCAQISERYAQRWTIEPFNAIGKQLLGVGQARNRVVKAVKRTVRFLIQTLVTVWYAFFGYHPDDFASRHAAA